MEKHETVGKVKVYYDLYSGTDEYSDGAVEDKLLKIVQEYPADHYDEIIRKSGSWPVMYHLSGLRENIIRSMDIWPEDTILEIGAGCGAVTGGLAGKGAITCVDLSKKRSLINAYRHRDMENLEIIVANFEDAEKYLGQFDVITLIGVLEYADLYIHKENAGLAFLQLIRKHLKEGGRLYIAIENRFGLKYWAGCQEDHMGGFFSGLEGYPKNSGVRTYGRENLESVIQDAGYSQTFFYYPYPDYKFPMVIYSDDCLPGKGELLNNNMNFDRDKIYLFEESKVYDALIDEKKFPFFSNSFLVEAKV